MTLPHRGLTPIRVGFFPTSARRGRLSDFPAMGLGEIAFAILTDQAGRSWG